RRLVFRQSFCIEFFQPPSTSGGEKFVSILYLLTSILFFSLFQAPLGNGGSKRCSSEFICGSSLSLISVRRARLRARDGKAANSVADAHAFGSAVGSSRPAPNSSGLA